VNGPAETTRIDPCISFRTSQPEPTFRDPAGHLFLTPHHALRRIHPSAAEATRAFLASPLRAALEKSGDLIQSEIANPDIHACVEPGELWLEHPRVDPITYPWEWTPMQWRAAAELTLRIASQAISAGWTLKDATPLNIVFAGARPVLVDLLSFERRDPGSSVWLAYGQFVRTFLLPLVAAKYLSWPLQATLFRRDGYEPAEIYQALRPWQRLNPKLIDVVTLAALLEKPGAKGLSSRAPSSSNPELAAHILTKRIARLGRQVASTAVSRSRSQWSEYAQSATHYQASDTASKQQFVRNVFARCHAQNVLDIGANTGTYSLIAADTGAKVVSLDADTAAIEVLWTTAAQQNKPITALVANVARPTPAAGWKNREQLSLLDRLTGKFDLVLMLAVIHHLILREQLPLGHIAELCASLTTRWLVLEWVSPSDPMYQEWLRGRDDLYGHLSESDLQHAFSPFFSLGDRSQLANGRVLFLLEKVSGNSSAGALQSPDTEAAPA
jgi:SAM-dependent methyltransferase